MAYWTMGIQRDWRQGNTKESNYSLSPDHLTKYRELSPVKCAFTGGNYHNLMCLLPKMWKISTHGHHQTANTKIKTDYILCSQRWRRSIQSAKTRPGADCGSDHEILIAKFTLKLKKVGKTTSPFMYDVNQIPHNYEVVVTNRFKGLDLIRVPEELWMEVHDTVQEAVIKTSPQKRDVKRQNGCLRRPYK